MLTSENDTGPDDEGDATADTDMSTGERQSYSAVAVVEYYDSPPDDYSACSHAALGDEASRNRADAPATHPKAEHDDAPATQPKPGEDPPGLGAIAAQSHRCGA